MSISPRNFLQRGKACAVPFRYIFRSSGVEQEDRRDPARQRDQFESIQGAVQVEETNAVNHEDAFIRDKQFEFAASHSNIFICTLLCVALCFVILINCYTSQEDFNVFVNSVHQLDPKGVG